MRSGKDRPRAPDAVLLRARELTKRLAAPAGMRRRYRAEFRLGPLSFELKRGDAAALLGANGAGKTTLLRTAAGIYRREGGELEVAGRLSPIIGILPPFPPDLTVAEHLRGWRVLLGGGPAAGAMLELAGLEEQAEQPVRWLSSGERVRLGMAPGLLAPAEVYLIDEALAVCDPEFRSRAIQLLLRRCEQGAALLLAGQDLLTARALCQRGLLLERGRLSLDGELDSAIAAFTTAGGPEGGEAAPGSGPAIEAVEVGDAMGADGEERPTPIHIRLRNAAPPFQLLVAVKDEEARVLHSSRTTFTGQGAEPTEGVTTFEVSVPSGCLRPGRQYRVAVSVVGPDDIPLATREDAGYFGK